MTPPPSTALASARDRTHRLAAHAAYTASTLIRELGTRFDRLTTVEQSLLCFISALGVTHAGVLMGIGLWLYGVIGWTAIRD